MKLKLTMLFAFLSFAGFSQWVKLATPVNSPLNCLSFTDPDNGIVAGTKGVLLLTDDGGQTWSTLMNSPMEDYTCVYMQDSQIMFAGGNSLYRTNNGGETWTMVSDMSSPQSIAFSDPLTGKCTSVSGIYETIDGGLTWTEVPTPNTSIYESVQSFDSTDITMGNVGGMITYSAVARRTSNGQWYDFDVFSFPNSYAWTGAYYPTPDTGYVFLNQFNRWIPSDHNQFIRLSNFELTMSISNELNWFFTSEIINDQVPDYMISLYFMNNSNGYACGEKGSIYYTKNGGIDWNIDYSGTVTLSDMKFINSKVAYAVGYDGTVLKLDLTTNSASPELSRSFRVYPNPAVNSCTVSGITGVERIEIISPSGQTVKVTDCNGKDEVQISLNDLVPGLYMIKYTANDQSTGISKLVVKK